MILFFHWLLYILCSVELTVPPWLLTNNYNQTLLYLEVSTRAVIGQFRGPYVRSRALYDPQKFKAVVVAKLFRDLSLNVFNLYSN